MGFTKTKKNTFLHAQSLCDKKIPETHSFQTLFYDLVLCTKIHTHTYRRILTHTHTHRNPLAVHRAPHFHCAAGAGVILSWGTKIPSATWCSPLHSPKSSPDPQRCYSQGTLHTLPPPMRSLTVLWCYEPSSLLSARSESLLGARSVSMAEGSSEPLSPSLWSPLMSLILTFTPVASGGLPLPLRLSALAHVDQLHRTSVPLTSRTENRRDLGELGLILSPGVQGGKSYPEGTCRPFAVPG